MNPKVTYNAGDDVLLVWFSENDIYDAEMVGSAIMHVGKDGEPVLLEILDASAFVNSLTETIAATRSALDVKRDAA